ncbi:MAG: glycosyltransferase family 4 protein [Candidatus Stahlbacteria bacterium]|nr:glycosyltransferase family 4 protein [Candidatus Stahlbacteria bacterium]
MKILLVSDAHRTAGAEFYLYSLAKGLKQRGYRVKLLCPDRKEWNELAGKMAIDNLDVNVLPLKSRHDFGRFYFLAFLYLPQIIKLKRKIQQLNPDILHINTAVVEDGQTIIIAGRLARVKNLINTFHTGQFIPYTIKGVRIRLIDSFRKIVVRKVISFIKAIIAVSFSTAYEINQKYGVPKEKFKIIYNGIEVSKFNLGYDKQSFRNKVGLDENGFLVTCVSNLHLHKGLNYLLAAIPDVLKEFSDVHFLFVGDGEQRVKLLEQSRSLGIDKNVVFIGKSNNVPSILGASDIFVLPSLWEGFPLVILEAMAAGLPIVATRVGGIPEMITSGEEGFLVDPCNSNALFSAIKKILNDSELAKKMGIQAKLRARNFSVNHMVEKTCELYESMSNIS